MADGPAIRLPAPDRNGAKPMQKPSYEWEGRDLLLGDKDGGTGQEDEQEGNIEVTEVVGGDKHRPGAREVGAAGDSHREE